MDIDHDEISIGPYRGWIATPYRSPDFLKSAANMAALVRDGGGDVLSGDHAGGAVLRISVQAHGRPVDLAVKSYARRNGLQDWIDRCAGTRATRSTRAAVVLEAAGVGTPAPVGYLDRWDGGRLVESYLLTRYVEAPSFKDELIRLYRHDPQCEKIMTLMQRVAGAVRAMHAAGVFHRDLGNQNILVIPDGGDDWRDVCFIDLNRSCLCRKLTPRRRGREISRLSLPPDLLRVFVFMYFQGNPPAGFAAWESQSRFWFACHTWTRAWRHPLRERRLRMNPSELDYPPIRDIWIWDERSGQPIRTLRSRNRLRYCDPLDIVRVGFSIVSGLGRVRKTYRELVEGAYRQPVTLSGRIGIALNPTADTNDREEALFHDLNGASAWVRFYRHGGQRQWDHAAACVDRMHAAGRAVSVALVQDRTAVLDSRVWSEFCRAVFERVSGKADAVEVGHAINRSKWGIWSLAEYRRLLETTVRAHADFPDVPLIGPAVIDFEHQYVISATNHQPPGMHFSALSHHMYVDRRGAPEDFQGRYDSLRKLAMLRAIARCAEGCEDRVIVSETNWPILGTGVYSPVGAPYVAPGPRRNDPSVSEEDYAAFMIRYLLIALCSGLVDQVYWWRLVARGYGLVDDTVENEWRLRSAFDFLRFFLSTVGQARFIRRSTRGRNALFFEFEQPGGGRVVVAYAHPGTTRLTLPFGPATIFDAAGRPIEQTGDTLELDGTPRYIVPS